MKMRILVISIIAAMIFILAIIVLSIWIWADKAMDNIAGVQKSQWVEKIAPDGKKYYFPKDGIKIAKTVKKIEINVNKT